MGADKNKLEVKMNHNEFTQILRQKYPNIQTSKHGEYANGATKNSVEIAFEPGGKLYSYRGSYTAILDRLGCGQEWRLADYLREPAGPIVIDWYWTQEAADTARLEYMIKMNSDDNKAAVEKWGGVWNKYSELDVKVEYFKSRK